MLYVYVYNFFFVNYFVEFNYCVIILLYFKLYVLILIWKNNLYILYLKYWLCYFIFGLLVFMKMI